MATDLVSVKDADGHRSKIRRTSGSSTSLFYPRIDVEEVTGNETRAVIAYLRSINPGPGTICFGMIEASVPCNNESIRQLRRRVPATEQYAELELSGTDDETILCDLGCFEQPEADVLQFLLKHQFAEAQAIVHPLPPDRTGRSARSIAQPTRISINLYGSSNPERAKNLGRALSDNKIYLQHPVYPLAGYLYSNPQLISRTYDVITEHTLTGGVPIPTTSTQSNVVPVAITDSFSMFDGLCKAAVLSEESESWRLQTPLLRHQKEGLYFLKRREQGLSIFDVSSHPPAGLACIKGGILADYMGLGKTLTFLSLIAENPAQKERSDARTHCSQKHRQGGTLVIAPLSTLGNWERQITEHVKPGTLGHYVFHGARRRHGGNTLHKHDVVLTSYDIISQEWRAQNNNKKESSLHGIEWFRVILDEAHEIRTEKTQRAEAIYALSSTRRWCITGTPIHNHLGDLASLFRFLQYQPLHTKAGFERYVTSAGEKGMDNLRSALRAACLRRVKSSVNEIQLPPRSESLHYLELSYDERILYESQLQALSLSDWGNRGGRSSAEKIKIWLKLRQICAFGENLPPTNNVRGVDNPNCIGCGAVALKARDMDVDDGMESFGCPHRTICLACAQAFPTEVIMRGNLDTGCEKCLSIQSPTPAAVENYRGPSTKVKALLEAIQEVEPQLLCPPKHVVFSTWTRLLDFIAIELNLNDICFCRLDGTMDLRSRNKTIEDFHSSDTKRVILISLTAGGVGINLTCASRVHMMEPHWNPQIENQAVERVHRLGQKNPVTIVRYIVRNSIEIDVRNRQQGKLELAHKSLHINNGKSITNYTEHCENGSNM